MSGIADEFMAYQALLEGHRAHPDDDLIYEDMLKARRSMEVAWLKHGQRSARVPHMYARPIRKKT